MMEVESLMGVDIGSGVEWHNNDTASSSEFDGDSERDIEMAGLLQPRSCSRPVYYTSSETLPITEVSGRSPGERKSECLPSARLETANLHQQASKTSKTRYSNSAIR